MRAADDWAANTIPHVVAVDTVDLPRTAYFNIHLTDISELVLGRRWAVATESSMP